MQRSRFHIGGEWVEPVGSEVFETRSAATEELIGTSPAGAPGDIDAAVEAARRALPGWKALSGAERAERMEALAAAVERRAEEIGRLIAQEVGTPIRLATAANVAQTAQILRFYASLARDLRVEEPRAAAVGRTLVRREPVGVVGMIVPWNYPILLAHFKLGPALAAGCTAVVKPAPETALSSYLLADAVEEAGLPAGVVNIVPAGRETGEYLVRHPGVDKIAFTGSTATGRRIGRLCGEALKPVTLELGGKSAAVLLDDAPLETFLRSIASVCVSNNGQTCVANTRILAPRHRYAEVVDGVVATMAGYRVGDPLDPGTRIGPVASAAARDRVEGYLAKGRSEGARVALGGGRPADRPVGWFVEPTVFSEVDPGMTVAREEIFGPVLAVLPYDGGDEGAAAAANDSDYGLGGSVWSADPDRALSVARRVDTGTIGVNMYNLDTYAPFGGHRASGIGYELGPEALAAYTKLTSIYLPA